MKTRLAVFVLCASSLLSGQAMKIERSGYEPEIKTNLMVATVVTTEYALPADVFTRSIVSCC